MKNKKVMIFICAAVNIILLIICAIFYFQTDREKPEFKLMPSEIIYSSDMDREKLLENISAADNQDGDITKRIVIEKIVENQKESSAIVFYAVSDKANNVAKISREFQADLAKEETEIVPETTANEETQETETVTETVTETEADSQVTEENTSEEETTEEESSVDTLPPEEEVQTPENMEEAESDEVIPPPQDSTGKPVITLKAAEISTTVGTPPAWVKVIETLQDDKDNYETLFYNLNVSKYDLNKKGNYKVMLTTKDSQGNISEPVTLTVNVK